MGKKFRIRRFIRQYFKENHKEELLFIDTTNFSDRQNKVIMAELRKKNTFENSRRRNQAVSITTHKTKGKGNDYAKEKE